MSAADSFFVDSNLVLYFVDPVDPVKRSRAQDWLTYLWSAGAGRLSWQVLHEFYWNAIRKMGLSAADARRIVEDLSCWRPIDTSFGLVSEAWEWMDAAQLTYWDSLIMAAAVRSGARYLLSEDFQSNRVYGNILVVNPFERAPSLFEASAEKPPN